MNTQQLWNAYYMIVRKETVRIFRIWAQTFLPSVITSLLYFTVFGKVLGSRVGEIMGFPYIQFVVPGLVMLSVITNAFTNTSTSFFGAKFMARNIDELLVSPTPPWVIIAGFVSGGMIRGILVGVLVTLVSLVFAVPPVHHPWAIVFFLILASMLFSLGGLVNGIYGKSFDSISIVPTFVITPVVYLAGVFYSIHQLPPFFQQLTMFNPIFYMVNGFRYGFLGIADVSIATCSVVLITLSVVLCAYAFYLIRTGLGLKQ
jgi:ABC-2 type transport system permease protein